MDESRVLRDRQAWASAAIDRAPSRGRSCADALLVVTTEVNAYPTAPQAYYACHPVQINGAAYEGATASYVADTATVLSCWNIGSAVPPQGTRLVAHGVGGRYVISYNGG